MLPGMIPQVGFMRVPVETQIPQATGTPIGGLDQGGGLAAAFDGNTSQDNTTGAYTGGSHPTSEMWIGKTFSAPKVFSRLQVYSCVTDGFQSGANPSITLRVRGKNGAAPASATDGTIISNELTFTDVAATMKELVSIDLVTAWTHVFLEILPAANANACCAEIYMWEMA